MKTYRYLFAAFAATVALASCTQDFLNEQGSNSQNEGLRTIAVSFGPQTRTALDADSVTPKFVAGDEIMVTSAQGKDKDAKLKTETCSISVDGSGNASFTTTLTGELWAYYPASAAGVGEKIGFAVPATQSGKFADANYAWATIPADATAATFENVFPLFVITPPEGSKSLTIKSLPQIGGDGQRSGNPYHITTEGDGCTITVSGTDTDGKYYVVLDSEVRLSNLSFDAASETAGNGWMLGITEAQAGDNNVIAENKAYKVGGAANWHEYVTIGGRKWATVNLGATTPAEPGDYFMWGEVKGHKIDPTIEIEEDEQTDNVFKQDFANFDHSDARYTTGNYWNPEYGFDDWNAPYYIHDTDECECYDEMHDFIPNDKYPISDTAGEDILALSDDAAYVNWGGAWRMPNKDEIGLLVSENVTNAYVANYENSGKQGVSFTQNNNTIFIPIFGYGQKLNLLYPHDFGYCWSSTRRTNANSCCSLDVSSSLDSGTGKYATLKVSSGRAAGMPIRAIVGESNSDSGGGQ